jgi:glycosyltransferase 2 family protein
MKKNLQILIKILVSLTFLFLVFRKINIKTFLDIIKGCYLPIASTAVVITVLLSFLLALRWFILLKSQTKHSKIRYFNLWKLTMVGILFNNFLPTGAGGDIAKVFYLIKGEEKKLLLGSSVLIDRFIGALTVITMGAIAVLFTPQITLKIKYLIFILLTFLVFTLIFFSNKRLASIPYSALKRFIPRRLKNNLENIYGVLNKYLATGKYFLLAMGLSFLLQSISIFTNYLMSISLLWKGMNIPGINLFFIYIPLIWTATIIPSLGGLGIREWSYVYFFKDILGREKAFALSILFLLTIVLQSVIGAVIMLFLKVPSEKK